MLLKRRVGPYFHSFLRAIFSTWSSAGAGVRAPVAEAHGGWRTRKDPSHQPALPTFKQERQTSTFSKPPPFYVNQSLSAKPLLTSTINDIIEGDFLIKKMTVLLKMSYQGSSVNPPCTAMADLTLLANRTASSPSWGKDSYQHMVGIEFSNNS